MASRFQAATLVASPSYPNSIAWSDENLIAVASGHLVTILVNMFWFLKFCLLYKLLRWFFFQNLFFQYFNGYILAVRKLEFWALKSSALPSFFLFGWQENSNYRRKKKKLCVLFDVCCRNTVLLLRIKTDARHLFLLKNLSFNPFIRIRHCPLDLEAWSLFPRVNLTPLEW